MLEKVRAHIRLPEFMHPSNLESMKSTPEFWFAGRGAGAKAHMDSHIQATMSLQLAGTKRWRLGLMEPRRAPFLSTIYSDGDVYNRDEPWRPQFNVTLRPGDALFFPPGFVHETLNVDEDPNACSASVTFQLDHPMAARMYRRFLPRVRRTADIHEAWPLITAWATLYQRAESSKLKLGMPYFQAKREALSGEGVGAQFNHLDRDRDGVLTLAELEAVFNQEAANILAFHDTDENGRVERAEFVAVFGFWAATVHAVLRETPEKYRAYQLEDMEQDFNVEDLPQDLHADMRAQSFALERAAAAAAEVSSEL